MLFIPKTKLRVPKLAWYATVIPSLWLVLALTVRAAPDVQLLGYALTEIGLFAYVACFPYVIYLSVSVASFPARPVDGRARMCGSRMFAKPAEAVNHPGCRREAWGEPASLAAGRRAFGGRRRWPAAGGHSSARTAQRSWSRQRPPTLR